MTGLLQHIDILARFGEKELLPGELLERVLVSGESLNLFLKALDVSLQVLHLLLLAADGESGLDPSEKIVPLDDAEKDKENSGDDNGEADERTLLLVRPVLRPVPYVAELSHAFSIWTKLTNFAEKLYNKTDLLFYFSK